MSAAVSRSSLVDLELVAPVRGPCTRALIRFLRAQTPDYKWLGETRLQTRSGWGIEIRVERCKWEDPDTDPPGQPDLSIYRVSIQCDAYTPAPLASVLSGVHYWPTHRIPFHWGRSEFGQVLSFVIDSAYRRMRQSRLH